MFTYTYEDTSLGAGVDIYVIDTGINIGHNEFGGRAEYGWSAYSSADDGNGHGTHCSGTAAGSSFGVSSNANLIAVRILDSSGSGTTSAVLGGLDYVVDAHNARKSQSGFIGSVASMSWGFTGRSTVVEEALTAMVDAGVHGAAAAGNSNTDACTMTPGSLGGDGPLVSVGASDIDDEIAYFSNTGPCVDVYAPGVDVLSAWRGSSSATNVISGTSMATPHIAGLMAYLLEQNGSMSPAQLKQMIVNMAIEGELQTRSDIVRGGELIIANNGVTTVQEVSIQSEAFPYEMEMVEGGNKLYW
ncbi:peptidase S8/S53 domain-containing protein [Lineolata rhizophorae]|uniref:Peptidase S8/S53 domain-containing protein n=1 Tax=Lineolata rhizophorae TaxID=578093 RepID=A0A6A6NZF1_9PEZI|nr:peptidase S8/S53 domain-containing protein [Lineolata rhizophorae]